MFLGMRSLALILLGITLAWALPPLSALIEWGRAGADLTMLTWINEDYRRRIGDLEDEIVRLKSSKRIEQILRDEYGYLKRGEIEVRFQ